MGYLTFCCPLPKYLHLLPPGHSCSHIICIGAMSFLLPYRTQGRDVSWWIRCLVWMTVQLQECSHWHQRQWDYAAKDLEDWDYCQSIVEVALRYCPGIQMLQASCPSPYDASCPKEFFFFLFLSLHTAQPFFHRHWHLDIALRMRTPTMWLQALDELHLFKWSFAFEFSGADFHPEALHQAWRRGTELGWTSEEQAVRRLLPAMLWPACVPAASRHASGQ